MDHWWQDETVAFESDGGQRITVKRRPWTREVRDASGGPIIEKILMIFDVKRETMS